MPHNAINCLIEQQLNWIESIYFRRGKYSSPICNAQLTIGQIVMVDVSNRLFFLSFRPYFMISFFFSTIPLFPCNYLIFINYTFFYFIFQTYHLLTKQTDHPFSIPIRDSFIEFLSPFVCLSLLANQKVCLNICSHNFT